MNKLIQLYKNKSIFLLFILTFLLTVLAYMIVPFMAMYTMNKGTITLSELGIIIGIGAFSTSIFSMLSGNISNKIGLKTTLTIGLAILGLSYISYVYAYSFFECFSLIILSGLGQALINPVLKSLIAINKKDLNTNYIFRIRYMLICFCIIIGPLLGNFLSLASIDYIFIIVGISHILIIALLYIFNVDFDIKEENNKALNNTNQVCSKKIVSVKLLSVTIIGILVFSVFSIFESATPLALSSSVDNTAQVFSLLIIYNSILALTIQPLIIFIDKKLSLSGLFSIGCILFMVSYLIFGFSNGGLFLLLLATTIFTFGEAILIPLLDILVDRFSTDKNKATFFAFSELKQFGFFAGPALAGYIIDKFSSNLMYYITAFSCILVLIIFKLLNRNISKVSDNIGN